MEAVKQIYTLMNYYKDIDFNSLSKFEIKEDFIDTDADIIFMISNALHKSRKGNYTITKQDKLYYKKILKKYGTNNS
jgi:hypothetical protein